MPLLFSWRSNVAAAFCLSRVFGEAGAFVAAALCRCPMVFTAALLKCGTKRAPVRAQALTEITAGKPPANGCSVTWVRTRERQSPDWRFWASANGNRKQPSTKEAYAKRNQNERNTGRRNP